MGCQAGHVVRMPDHRFPKRIVYSELLATGNRSRGGQRKRYKDTLKVALKQCSIDPETWEQSCVDGMTWRQKVESGAKDHETRRIAEAQRKRNERKERAIGQTLLATSLVHTAN